MRQFLTIIIVLYGLHLPAQPNLERAFDNFDIPKLEIEQLKDRNILCLKHKEGIVLYNQTNDTWKLYQKMKSYEALGQIQNIYKINETIVVSMQEGSLILNGEKIEALAIPVKPIGIFDKKLWMFPDNNLIKALVSFDMISQNIHKVPLSEQLYGIKDFLIFNKKIWASLYSVNEVGYINKGFVRIDFKGNIKQLDHLHKSEILSIFQLNNNINILNRNGVFVINNNDSLVRKQSLNYEKYFSSLWSNRHNTYTLTKEVRDNEITLTQFNHKSYEYTEKKILLDAISMGVEFSDFVVFNKDIYCIAYNQVFKVKNKKISPVKRYIVKDSKPESFRKMVEDEKAAWFLSRYYGLTRYNKKDSSWNTYINGLDVKYDTTHFYIQKQITLNNKYVFIALTHQNSGRIKKYLIFDRKKEEFSFLTSEELIKKFFLSNDNFLNYNKNEKLTSLLEHIHEWRALLFFYDLPLSGVNTIDFDNTIIKTPHYNLLSFHVYHSSNSWYSGVLFHDKTEDKFEIIKFPRFMKNHYKNFNGRVKPYLIAGTRDNLYLASSGNSAKGIIEVDLKTGKTNSKPEWKQKFKDFSLLKIYKNYLIIGSYDRRLFVLNTQSGEIKELSEYISGIFGVWTLFVDEKYLYIGSYNDLIYLDKDLNYIGNLGKKRFRSSQIFNSGESIYIKNRNNLFRVVE